MGTNEQLSHTLSNWVAILIIMQKDIIFYSNAFIFGKLVLL